MLCSKVIVLVVHSGQLLGQMLVSPGQLAVGVL